MYDPDSSATVNNRLNGSTLNKEEDSSEGMVADDNGFDKIVGIEEEEDEDEEER
jgi:hypothetical protein